MMVETLITEKELCEWLRVSRSTLKKLRSKDLPCIRFENLVRYSKEEVNEWLEQHQGLLLIEQKEETSHESTQ